MKIKFSHYCSFLCLLALIGLFLFFNNQRVHSASQTNLENGVIIFSFADTYRSAYLKAFPLLNAYNWPAICYINPTKVDKFARLTEANLDILNSYDWDIASHGWTHADPTKMTDPQLQEHLQRSQNWLLERGYLKGARHYGPPATICDTRVFNKAREYYQTISAREWDICSLLPTGYSYNIIPANDSVGWLKVKKYIDNTKANNQVLILSFHDIVDGYAGGHDTSIARLTQTVDYVNATGKQVVDLSTLLDGH